MFLAFFLYCHVQLLLPRCLHFAFVFVFSVTLCFFLGKKIIVEYLDGYLTEDCDDMSNLTDNDCVGALCTPVNSRSESAAATSSSSVLEQRGVKGEISNLLSEKGDNHKKRLINLKKELEYLTETSWMYSPIEKILGQN